MINIEMDISDVVQKTRQLTELNKAQEKSLADLTNVTQTYNAAGILQSEVVKRQITASTEVVERTFNIGKAFESTTSQIKASADALRAFNQEQQRIKSQSNLKEIDKQTGGINFDASQSQKLEKIKSDFAKLNTIIVTPQIVEQYFAALNKGLKIEATGDLAKARDQLQKIVDLTKDVVAGPKITPIATNKMGLPGPDEAGIGRLTSYSSILEKVKTSLVYFAAYQGFSNIKESIGQAISDARQYQIQISLIRTLSQDAQLSTAQWGRELGNLSGYLGVDFKDAASATYDAISNQVAQGTKALEFVSKAGDFARVTNSTLKDSGNLFASIQNTYGAEAGNLDEIAAKLFKTIDRGRIVASDLANTFGRVAFSSKDVGLRFEEITGSLALLTRSGVTTDDAITLVNNLVQQVTKPSVELKKFFEEAGIGADRDAFKLKGLVGIVELFNKGIKEGKISAQEIFPEIRAQRAFSQFSSRPKDLQTDIDYTGDAGGGTYARALEIRAESSADKLAKISKAFQNTIANSIGSGFNDVLAGTFERVSGLNLDKVTTDAKAFAQATKSVEDALNRTIRIVVAAAAGYATLKTGLMVMTVVQEVQIQLELKRAAAATIGQAAQGRGIAVNAAETASLARLNAAKSGGGAISAVVANPYVGIAVAATAAIVSVLAYRSAVIETNNEAIQGINDLLNQMRKVEEARVLDKQVDAAKELNKELGEAAKKVGNDIGNALIGNNKLLEETREKSKNVGSELKSKFAGGLDIIRNKLQELNTEYATFDQRIKESIKSAGGFRDKLNDIVFSVKQQYGTPDQNIDLDKNRISALLTQAKSLYAQGTDEAVKEARTLFDRVGQLEGDLFNKQTKKRVDAAPSGSTVMVDTSSLESRLTNLAALRDQYESNINSTLLERKKIVETQVGEEKVRISKLETALKKFEEFSILTTEGKVKREFQTPTGKIDLDKVKKESEKVIADVVAQFPKDVAKRLEITPLILQKQGLIRDEVNQTGIKNDLDRKQTNIVNQTEDLKKVNSEGVEALKIYQGKTNDVIKTLRDLAKGIEATASAAPGRLSDAAATQGTETRFGRATGRIGEAVGNLFDDSGRNRDSFFDKLAQDAANLDKELDTLNKRTIDINGIKITDPKALEGAVDRAAKLKAELVALIEKTTAARGITNGDATATGDAFGLGNGTVGDVDKIITGLKERLKETNTDIDRIKGIGDNRDSITGLIGPLKEANAAYNQGASAAGAAAGGLAAALDATGRSAAAAAAAFNKFQTPEALNKDLENRGLGGGVIKGAERLGEPERQAYGGPIGYDNQVYKRNDEFVSNGSATTKYFSQLQGMNNSARVPESFSNDNYSVTVNESSTPQLTADAIMAMIARSKRKG